MFLTKALQPACYKGCKAFGKNIYGRTKAMPTKPKKAATFEQNLERLAEIVERVEDGATPLDTAISLYKDGISVAKECSEALRKYEAEVLMLQKDAEAFTLEPFFGKLA
jgi:exodeoxyribonuclease VII small subunit